MGRPKIHLTPQRNWMNDPVGFIYYKGQYHLFYQHFPYGVRWGTMHWGHAVSSDLVQWETMPIALYPSKDGDCNGCFSGSAVEDNGELVLFYTGVKYDSVSEEDIHSPKNDQFTSSQMKLTSPDGIQFDNEGKKRVIIPSFQDATVASRIHTRDPKVWKDETGWHLVLGSQYEENDNMIPQLLFFHSQDGEKWELKNRFSAKGVGSMWECPDLFPLGVNKWGLCISPIGFGKKGGPANIACGAVVDFRQKDSELSFELETLEPIDLGLDIYAAQSALDEEGRRVQTAWVRMPKPFEQEEWIGMITLPRVITEKNGKLYFDVHPNVKKMFTKKSSQTLSELPIRIEAEMRVGSELNIGGFQVRITESGLETDRSDVFPDAEGFLKIVQADGLDLCELDIYVDRGIIEIYVKNEGIVITQVVYGMNEEISCCHMQEPVCTIMEN